MATFQSVFYPTTDDLTGTVNATTSSAEIVIGPNRIFTFHSASDLNIAFGSSGMAAADTTFMQWDGGGYYTFDTGSNVDRIRIYNPGGSTATWWIQFLAR